MSELVDYLVDSQREQTERLRELSVSMVRVELALAGLPELRKQVDELRQESRDQKLAIKWLKGAGAAVIALCAWVVATFR